MKFKNALPEFYEEVKSLLVRIEKNDLLSQLGDLEIVGGCPCTEIGCGSFMVSGRSSPDGFETPGIKRSTVPMSVDLKPERGKIRVRLDQLGRITSFEVLNRPDIRRKLFKRS